MYFVENFDEYSMLINKKVTQSDKVSLGLRSVFATFCYDTIFFILLQNYARVYL